MLSNDRHERILAFVNAQGSMKTTDLVDMLEVSNETVRKDLLLLEQAGQLKRIHGGAVRLANQQFELPLPEREPLNRKNKAFIAQAACDMLSCRDTVFLDASSTVLAMTDFWPEKEITVLTNANHVVVRLGARSHVDIVCTGGEYERRSRSYIGVLAEEAVNRYLIERMFIGVDGFDPVRGASELNPGQARLKERLIPLAEEVVVLADHTKLNKKSAFFFAKPRQIHRLITDDQADEDVVERIRSHGIQVDRVSVPKSED